MLPKYHNMYNRLWIALLVLLVTENALSESTWSRQLSGYTSDISDWMPLSRPLEINEEIESLNEEKIVQPFKRQAQAQARILSEPVFFRQGILQPEPFSSAGLFSNQGVRQLYLQPFPTGPQNYLSDISGLRQGARLPLENTQTLPFSQGFVLKNGNYQNTNNGLKPNSDKYPQTPHDISKLYNFENLAPPESFTLRQQGLPEFQNIPFNYNPHVKSNVSNEIVFPNENKPVSLQKIKQEPQKNQENYKQKDILTESKQPVTNIEKEEVQLLYVPLETLNRGHFNFQQGLPTAHNLNKELYSPATIRSISPQQVFTSMPKYTIKSQSNIFPAHDYLQPTPSPQKNQEVPERYPKHQPNTQILSQSSFTTLKQKKLKPHQPPLAVFISHGVKKGENIKVSDVLTSLKNAQSISVLDSVSPENSPNVFIGPSSLKPPHKYVKFDLPYLSNIENSEKRILQLPFFVAPLSYKTPNGFAKIPFPSPHVGSVIVNAQMKEQNNSLFNLQQQKPIADVFPHAYLGAMHKSPTNPLSANQPDFGISKNLNKPTSSYFSEQSQISADSNQNRQKFQSQYFSLEPQIVKPLNAIPQKNDPQIVTGPLLFGNSYYSSPISSQTEYVRFPVPQPNPQKINYQTDENSKVDNKIHGHYITKQTHDLPKMSVTSSYITSTPASINSTEKITSSSRPLYSYIETHNPFSINEAFDFTHPFKYEKQETPTQPINSDDLSDNSKLEQQTTDVIKHEHFAPESGFIPQNFAVDNENILTNNNFRPIYNTESNESVEATHNTNIGASQQYSSSTPENTKMYVYDDVSTKIPYFSSHVENMRNKSRIVPQTTISSITNTPVTKRTPGLRGRLRQTTTKSKKYETSSADSIRKPLREIRPITSRTRYETSKNSDNPKRNRYLDSVTSTDSSIKEDNASNRYRSRGKPYVKVNEKLVSNDQVYGNKELNVNKLTEGNTESIAYQRDVLHQNYPVTLMERMSSINVENTTPYAQTQRITVREQIYNENDSFFTSKPEINLSNSTKPVTIEESTKTFNENDYSRINRGRKPINSVVTESNPIYENKLNSEIMHLDMENENAKVTDSKEHITARTINKSVIENKDFLDSYKESNSEHTLQLSTPSGFSYGLQKTITTTDITNKVTSNNFIKRLQETERRKNINTKQPESQSSSNEIYFMTTVSDKKRKISIKPVTYRPKFDRRRTTMRIDEIEADLKTKQVHVRPEIRNDGYRHPIYKPDLATTIAPEKTTVKKIAQFRRRRPVLSTLPSTVLTTTIQPIEQNLRKTRFRGRVRSNLSTSKVNSTNDQSKDFKETNDFKFTTEKALSSNTLSKYSLRNNNRLITTTEGMFHQSQDQESQHSINRPHFVNIDNGLSIDNTRWSPKLTFNSFKPFDANAVSDSKFEYGNLSNLKITTENIDIITANEEFDDILISVTPASKKNIENISLHDSNIVQALISPKKNEKSNSDAILAFESVLEEVMKNLEEKDENQYSIQDFTKNVKKVEKGEIGEIPPEQIISTGSRFIKDIDTTLLGAEITSKTPLNNERYGRRKGVWKKVKIRPISKEPLELAESQYFTHTANMKHLEGLGITKSYEINKNVGIVKGKNENIDKILKHEDISSTVLYDGIVSTETATEFQTTDNQDINQSTDSYSVGEIITAPSNDININEILNLTQFKEIDIETVENTHNPGDMDLGTGAPDETIIDPFYTQLTTDSSIPSVEYQEKMSYLPSHTNMMNYLMSLTSTEHINNTFGLRTNLVQTQSDNKTYVNPFKSEDSENNNTITVNSVITELSENEFTTTESSNYIPDEILTNHSGFNKLQGRNDISIEREKDNVSSQEITKMSNLKQVHVIENGHNNFPINFDTSSSDISTLKSTEISHETEICFRGRCIKASNDKFPKI